MASSVTTSTRLVLREEDVVKLACEFLQNRDMYISQVTLERESGVINGDFSDDLLFLRQLILDGQWEDVMEFIQPLSSLPNFQFNFFKYIVLKAKYFELLCIKSEFPLQASPESAVETVTEVLKELEKISPSKEQYSNLCLLLTVDKLDEHPEFRTWNPSKGRIACFDEVKPLVENLLKGEKKSCQAGSSATKDRLLQLIIKGILYESCVDYCQQKATGAKKGTQIAFTDLLNPTDFSDSDLSLLSWLQSIPSDTFSCPFEQRSLNVDVERIKAPVLKTNWTEHMLVTPIKPDIFPHSSVPNTRPKGVEIMTKSLHAQSPLTESIIALKGAKNNATNSKALSNMSKSFASFHLTGKKTMETSVDQLFFTKEEEHEQLPVEEPPQKLASVKEVTKAESPPKFINVNTIEDVQAVRCAEFHPSGKLYAIGSNSKTLRICQYPDLNQLSENHSTVPPIVLFKRTKHHKGSIYCLAWSPSGSLIATGSNDKTVKLMKFNQNDCSLEGNEVELSMHDGTVRDCIFLENGPNSQLITGGAGDCSIYVTDCITASPFQSLMGHGGHVLSLCSWGSQSSSLFASGSADKTSRFWDLRTGSCVNVVQYGGSSVASLAVDPSGRLLVTGHEDSSVILYDIRGCRTIQSFKPHSSEIRSVRFSPNAYYLLSAGYDNKVVLTDLQGDLSGTLPSVVVAQHSDKVISGRWHPIDFSFLSTSADKTATLWGLPPI